MFQPEFHFLTRRKSFGTQRGMTLTELMVAMVIGILLIGSVIFAFITSFFSFRTNDNLARLQESGRIAINMLERDLRNIGYTGGCGIPGGFSSSTALLEKVEQGIWKTSSAPNSASMELLTMRDGLISLTGDATAGNPGTVPVNSLVEKNDLVFIGDCGKGEIFEVQSVDLAALEIKGRLTSGYPFNAAGPNVDVISWESVQYMHNAALKTLKRCRNDAVDCSKDSNDEGVLTDNVEVFRVCVADHTGSNRQRNGNYITLSSAPSSTDSYWKRVAFIQVDLVISSPGGSGEHERSPSLPLCGNGDSFDPPDNRLYKLFSTTVALRNRLL
ncbi:MAG: PilW family protein [Zoogloeaceae bacterium]|jgi:type IV pilus assembly protein PilW|nr:PilW family protein [Zoogloeaceae bacterium]